MVVANVVALCCSLNAKYRSIAEKYGLQSQWEGDWELELILDAFELNALLIYWGASAPFPEAAVGWPSLSSSYVLCNLGRNLRPFKKQYKCP